MADNIAESIVATLKAAGVARVWGLAGDSLNAFTEALRVDGGLEWLQVRHEEAAAFAAGADAALTGELAVVAGSCGPGNLHFINGLFDAHRSRVPVLAIASHIPSEHIGSAYFQETHPQELFRECSVYCEMVSDPAQMPWVLEAAMRSAVEQQGVAVIVIPGDVFFDDAPARRPTAPIRRTPVRVLPTDGVLAEAAALLDAGERVTILAGAGVAGARDEVLALADRLRAPIVHALRGKEHIEHDNPFDVGMSGLLGVESGYRALKEADTLLLLGTDFPYRDFYPEEATVIQVDLRGSQIGRRTPVDLGVVGDVRETAAALVPLLRSDRDSSHLDGARRTAAAVRDELDDLSDDAGDGPIHPQYLMRLVDELAAPDAVFTADVGTPVIWAARHLSLGGGRRLIGSFSHGSMANALPQALGAKAADRSRQVVALAGDGGLSMLLGELLTIRQNGLPVVVVVFDNASYGFVELEMKAAGQVTFGTELENPDFAAVARAVGIRGERVEAAGELRDALTRAFASDEATLLDVVTARQELALPPSVSPSQAKGFGLWAVRSLLAGRGAEVLEVASTNARRIFPG